MTVLFYAHSGLRYLVLLMAVLALGVFLIGYLKKKPFGKVHRIIGASLAGLVHLQVLLGLTMVVAGRFYPALIGHIVMMLTAAIGLQVALTVNRRQPQPGFVLPLIGVVMAIMLIAGGIFAIGRGLFQTFAA